MPAGAVQMWYLTIGGVAVITGLALLFSPAN
jgi:hypothetical protein